MGLAPEVLISFLLTDEALKYLIQDEASECHWRQLFFEACRLHYPGSKRDFFPPRFSYSICAKCGEVFTVPNYKLIFPAMFHCKYRRLAYHPEVPPMGAETIDLINNILKTKGSLWQTKQAKTETAQVSMMK